MRNRIALLLVGLVVAVAFAVPASADTITFTTGIQSDGSPFYVGIYVGTLNGVTTDFVCDDYLDEITGGEQWDATVHTADPYTGGGYFHGGNNITNPFVTTADSGEGLNAGNSITDEQLYNMIGYLTRQIFNDPTDSGHQWGYLSYAIWSLTDDAWQSSFYTGNEDAIEAYLSAAYAARNTNPDLTIYTPTDCTHNPSGSCGGVNVGHGSNPPQEFLTTPEAGTPLLLGLAFFGGSFLRKRLLA